MVAEGTSRSAEVLNGRGGLNLRVVHLRQVVDFQAMHDVGLTQC